MHRHRFLAFSLAAGFIAFGAPARAVAQNHDHPTPNAQADSGRMRDPSSRILALKAELKLSDQQVKQLEEIRSKYDARNKPLMDEVHKAWSDRAAVRDSVRKQNPEAAKALDSLRQSRRESRKEALAVLTDQQRSQFEKVMKEQRKAHWKHYRHERVKTDSSAS